MKEQLTEKELAEKIEIAYRLGKEAFSNDISCSAHDKKMEEVLKGLKPSNQGTKILKAWKDGWTNKQLETAREKLKELEESE